MTEEKGKTREFKVLVIEDHPTDGLILRRVIERSALATVELVNDGLRGLNRCFEAPPDALVLDLELPSLRGEEILRMLRSSQRFQQLPVIITSDLPDAKRREMEMLHIGADFYLEKPLNEEVLLQALREVLEKDGADLPTMISSIEPIAAPAGGREDATKELQDPPLHYDAEETAPSGEFIMDKIDSAIDAVEERRKGSALGPLTATSEPFNGYRLMEMIGSGGMGTVYKAVQLNLNRLVALKVLLKSHAETPQVLDRFRQEARIMASLSHPNIVQVYDASYSAFTFYISMEFAEGGSLNDRMKKIPISIHEFYDIAIQACDALIYLHRKGVIHRDIKPGNIFFTADGTVKLGDFGISRAQAQQAGDTAEKMTAVRQIMGTPSYMPPEVTLGMEATPASDQFSLGKTFLRIFLPRIKQPQVEHLRERRPDIPEALADVLDRMISWTPDDRYPSMDAVKQALSALRTAN